MNTQTLTPAKPVRVVNFAKILPLFEPVNGTSLVPLRGQPIHTRLVAKSDLPSVTLETRRGRALPAAALERPVTQRFSVTKTTGTLSPIAGTENLETAGIADLDLPFGMPRFVNAATLKRMLKAKRSDLLLKKSGARWEICEDSTRIDLTDDSIEFRLGAVQIFS